ncbi:hypothetical protein CBR_g78738 [Chara braunii]|uniref:Uncharacterized protein n=1 Tax=Chara braunii TaxID=69332 RepID=A0A388JKG3_CHABU|nr:hypothetical protein CBR_g78738 [Chara braunii]|eukprot:GBG45308.1 hypothetical protein CBR_g78738 [Chara braunii]
MKMTFAFEIWSVDEEMECNLAKGNVTLMMMVLMTTTFDDNLDDDDDDDDGDDDDDDDNATDGVDDELTLRML